ncbi:Fc receptor-like A isoform X2 [Oncorhynchus nerka]|uniref:Fc receptor-like A isoform X2 n=1 Tax=Oncorhynchus nerka TaxID=8023 RepID=UPI0011300C2E|nr:Fc receptor-like A isoform X2 [Oncorhynchus nerka]
MCDARGRSERDAASHRMMQSCGCLLSSFSCHPSVEYTGGLSIISPECVEILHTEFTEVLLMPTLTVEPSGRQVYSEDTVTLACQLPGHSGLGWQFYWHKDRQDTGPVEQMWGSGGGGAVYQMWRASVTHTGQYWCRAGRGQPVFYTQYSQAVSVNVIELFTSVTLSAFPSTVVKEGGAFNLTCEAQFSNCKLSQHHGNHSLHSHPDPDRNWTTVVVTFSFLRDGWPVARDSVSGMYSVARASRCHMGTYSCVARAGRARRSSQEISITLDNLSLILVACFGTFLILSVAPLAFFVRLYAMRLWQLRGRGQGELQCNECSTIQGPKWRTDVSGPS